MARISNSWLQKYQFNIFKAGILGTGGKKTPDVCNLKGLLSHASPYSQCLIHDEFLWTWHPSYIHMAGHQLDDQFQIITTHLKGKQQVRPWKVAKRKPFGCLEQASFFQKCSLPVKLRRCNHDAVSGWTHQQMNRLGIDKDFPAARRFSPFFVASPLLPARYWGGRKKKEVAIKCIWSPFY